MSGNFGIKFIDSVSKSSLNYIGNHYRCSITYRYIEIFWQKNVENLKKEGTFLNSLPILPPK